MVADTVITMFRHLKAALLVAILAGLLAGAFGFVQARDVYNSSVTIQLKLVGEAQPEKKDSDSAVELLATAQSLINSPLVLVPAGEKLDPPVTGIELARQVRFSLPTNSMLMILSVQGRSEEETAEVVEAISASFQQRLAEAPIQSADGRLELQWYSAETRTELAEAAAGPLRTILSAVLAGILMGIAYLLARVLLDQKARTPHRIASVTDVSVVAVTGSSPSHETIAQLARNLDFVIAPSLGRRVLAVADTGTHTTSAAVITQLAEELRRQGNTTAVIDSDLRARPLGARDQGLSAHLSHESLPETQPAELLAGPVPPNPVELLSRPVFAHIIDSYRATHDWTLVNCPPVLPVSDTAVISRHFDGLLLLVDAEHDTKAQLAEALATLEAGHAKVAGLVLVTEHPPRPTTPYAAGATVHVSS
ncbi:MAG: hypothetical protein Q4P15_00950 [Propionibacteriaceae bacterium]|nr:hypothetical protein [Propionibacteriaceae bacterium]